MRKLSEDLVIGFLLIIVGFGVKVYFLERKFEKVSGIILSGVLGINFFLLIG